MELKDWLQILVTIIISGTALWISLQQYKVARAKVRLDALQERYSAFTALNKLLESAVSKECKNLDKKLFDDYYIASTKARFLFDENIANYFQEIRQAITSTESYNKNRLQGMDQKYDKMLYLAEQLDKKFEIFKPYLKMDI